MDQRILTLATVPLLFASACGREPEGPVLDAALGRECFSAHLPKLPPGSQYEGFEVAGDRLRVRVMTGSRLQTVDCLLQTTTDGEHSVTPAPP